MKTDQEKWDEAKVLIDQARELVPESAIRFYLDECQMAAGKAFHEAYLAANGAVK